MTKSSKLSDLHPAKRNARKHSERNLDMIETSIKKFGTGRSILVDENSEVIAGSGTLQAAQAAGITKVKMVDAQPDELVAVRRTGLSEQEKDGLAVADNRTSELASWDTDVLEELSNEIDLEQFFSDDELAGIFDDGDTGAIKEVEVKPPPTIMWVLIGVDINSYGEVIEHIQENRQSKP
jgi:hypothetical protein